MINKWVLIGAGLLIVGSRATAQVSVNGVNYVNTYKALAIAEEQRTGVPAAITLAQGLHESQAGTSELVKSSNNHFGVKCKEDWKGAVYYHDDDARHECFRSYTTAADSYRDHSDFLRQGSRYAFLFKLEPTDYEGWAYGLKKAGYATNIRYSQILIKLVKDYNLEQYTLIAMGKMAAADEVVLTAPGAETPVALVVGGVQGGSGVVTTDSAGGNRKTDAAMAVPDVSYPEGEFQINRARVVYVQAGTSLLSVANQYSVPLGRLLEFNDMKEEDVLVRGQLIFLQRKRRTGAIEYHVVREGEGVYDIAQAEGVRLQDILEMNQLASGEEPAVGERIFLQRSAPGKPRLAGN
ncbi:MAG TPA: glucosaminidase domain-containing protein [Puia sp.]|jgi:LysM repeat protein|nr:glucosaminidase domain-containing protein [Puia sp.]